MTHLNKSERQSELITALRRIAVDLGTTSVCSKIFYRRSGVPKCRVQRLIRFVHRPCGGGRPGSNEVRTEGRKFSNQQIIAEIARVLRIPHSKLTMSFFGQHSQMSAWTCAARFGTWFKALKATAEQLDPERDAALVSRIRAYAVAPVDFSDAGMPAPDATPPVPQIAAEQTPESLVKETPAEEADVPDEEADVLAEETDVPAEETDVPGEHTALYGDLIRFRSLEHAPINELGVVFLFGMISRELGYVVEMLNSGFPDCEAKRQVRPGIWQRVRIEFEFRSRAFSKHGHDPYQCDVIVCWEHNWPDCPIEMQELKSVVQGLSR